MYFENIPNNVLEAHAKDLFLYSDELLIDTLLGSIFSAWLNSIKRSLKPPHFFIAAVNTIYNYSSLKSCQHDFVAMFEQNPWNFYNHPNLSDLHEDIMKILVKRACQYGNGEVFLDVLIKWGIERNTSLVKEPFHQWKSKHFDLLANTISGVLQEVRFGQRPERYAHFHHLPFNQIFHGDFEELNWYKDCDIFTNELSANFKVLGLASTEIEIHAQPDSLPIPFTDAIQKVLVTRETENIKSSFMQTTKNWPRVKTSYNFVLSYHKKIKFSLPSFHEFFKSYLHSAPTLVVLKQGSKTVAGLSMSGLDIDMLLTMIYGLSGKPGKFLGTWNLLTKITELNKVFTEYSLFLWNISKSSVWACAHIEPFTACNISNNYSDIGKKAEKFEGACIGVDLRIFSLHQKKIRLALPC